MVTAAVCSAAVALGAYGLVSRVGGQERPPEVERAGPAGMGTREGEFTLFEPTWTTAHIYQKGINVPEYDTGLVVSYIGPAGRNPGEHDDWVGIYEQGRLDTSHRKDWDWVCPNEHERCKSFGSAIVPAGNDGLESGKTYTVAYWLDRASESSGTPAVTIDYVVPW
ncbi:hypothetical protein PZB75_08440 [Streptomyces sp. AM 4-1-1]|uniref:hypothetical protein n=1 Tax=Streptomyces sp. AM 4-1-1 TaxID=3028710 RepID=UPI0023B89B76|nr:hypothetical protein [Streptomyces sp. AM 4-1-1]WEH33405.1 hypothetical protein PZB75_08440 [Streptomyces sp. AM 4-1-1]